VLLYYITDRRQFPGSAGEQRRALLTKIEEAARCGLDFIQLREKDLSARELLPLASDALAAIRNAKRKRLETGNRKPETRLLINSRVDVALAARADGVHLRGDDLSPADARATFTKAAAAGHWPLATDHFLLAVSCHTPEQVRRAQSDGADFVVFAPVFEKAGRKGVGLGALRQACRGIPPADTPEAAPALHIPVLALGGVTLDNAADCLQAGASGLAAIRLFQDNDVAEVVARLRAAERPANFAE
jgi:thiamine-phosphate pyrophosphorylase